MAEWKTTRTFRALCFDLENRPLAYWYDGATTSEITAFGWKWADEKTVSTLLLVGPGEYVDDTGHSVGYEEAHVAFTEVLVSAGLVYGHNIRRHDLPMLQAWRMRLGLSPLPALLTSDTCRDIPRRKDLSVSLENLAELYELRLPKHRMSQPAWERANQLHPDGISEARTRVVSDVLLQEAVRKKAIARDELGPPKRWSC